MHSRTGPHQVCFPMLVSKGRPMLLLEPGRLSAAGPDAAHERGTNSMHLRTADLCSALGRLAQGHQNGCCYGGAGAEGEMPGPDRSTVDRIQRGIGIGLVAHASDTRAGAVLRFLGAGGLASVPRALAPSVVVPAALGLVPGTAERSHGNL